MHDGIGQISVPAASFIGIQGKGLVPGLVKQGREIFGSGMKIAGIGGYPGRQKGHGISRQEFKFSIGTVSADVRYMKRSFQKIIGLCPGIFGHGVIKREIVFIDRKTAQNGRIKKRLVHNYNDIRRIIFGTFGIFCQGRDRKTSQRTDCKDENGCQFAEKSSDRRKFHVYTNLSGKL